jgi:hypothetical protein
MVYFKTNIPKMGRFLRALDWIMFIYFMALKNILRAWKVYKCPFGTGCVDLVQFSGFGITYQEKSGNPDVSLSRTKPKYVGAMVALARQQSD